MSKDLKELEGKIGYKFDDFTLFTKAMIHSSYANEKHLPKYECNERLEFLGDAVLELVSSEFLFHNNPKLPEGELTKTRASMYVNRHWHSAQEIWILANTFCLVKEKMLPEDERENL